MAKTAEPRCNEQIRAPQVRLIDSDGSQLGLQSIAEALRIAEDRGHDLVEIAPNAKPPVCKVLDYSKYRYEKEKQRKEAKKHQKGGVVKEVRLRMKISENDLETKVRAIHRFLKERNKVRVSMAFYGREMAHRDVGQRHIGKIKEMLGSEATIESEPQMMGNRMILMLAPKK